MQPGISNSMRLAGRFLSAIKRNRMHIFHPWQRTTAKTVASQRPDCQLTIADFQPQMPIFQAIQIRMGNSESVLFLTVRASHSIDIMVSVALDMGQTKRMHQRQVLLHP